MARHASVEVADNSRARTTITGRKALHYVLLFGYNHRTAITPRRHRGPGTDTRIDAPEARGSCNTINNTINQRGPLGRREQFILITVRPKRACTSQRTRPDMTTAGEIMALHADDRRCSFVCGLWANVIRRN